MKAARRGEVDLTSCDREPIHVPGSVQAHGAMLALDPRTLRIEQASEGVEAFLGRAASELVGRRCDEALPADVASSLTRAVLEGLAPHPRHIGACPRGEVLAHRWDDVIVVEIEPAAAPDDELRFAERLREHLDACERTDGLEGLQSALVRTVRDLTGYDRVMFYRFGADGSGTVVAEEKPDEREAFQGLRYPATDIPKQARALMVRTRSRLHVDNEAEPRAIVPLTNSRTGRPLDMSYATLRSVSPVHREYLANMGVRATLTLSIVVEGALWGLIACHHYAGPRHVTYDARLSCDFLARAASLLVQQRLEQTESLRRRRLDEARDELAQDLLAREVTSPEETLAAIAPTLAALVPSDGFAYVGPEGAVTVGRTPPEAELQRVAGWLREANVRDVWATDSLVAAGLPGAAALREDASGLLAFPLSSVAGQWLIWLRPEQRVSVTWAGDPTKSVAPGRGDRLHPRASFAAWEEEVRGRSVAWSGLELDAARKLRALLAEVVYRRAEALDALTEQLRRHNEELDAFAYVASHDLKEPLRTIRNYSEFLLEDYGERLDDEGRRMLERIGVVGDRMRDLIQGLLRFSRAGRRKMTLEDVDLSEVLAQVREELDARIVAAGATLAIEGELPTVRADRTMLREILTNLVSNALKYSDGPPWVEVGVRPLHAAEAELSPGAERCVYVRDHGIGIPSEHFQDIFRIFRRLHPSDAYDGGTGAGLTIVQNLVARHRGAIWLTSEPGEGTTFFFTLDPLAEEAP